MPRRQRIRLALPDNELLPQLCDHLRRCGFHMPALDGPGFHVLHDPLGMGLSFEVFKLDPADVGAYVEHGIAELGVMSTDLLAEGGAEVWRPFTFNYGAFPLVLASLQGMSLENLIARPVVRLATSLPNLTRDIFAARGLAIEVVPVSDSRSACVFGLADGYVDRLTDPETLKQEGFRVLELLGHARHKLIVNQSCYVTYDKPILDLIDRLYTHQPPTPAPMSIPFDRDEL